MTEQQRWRLWTRLVGGSLLAGVALTGLALALRNRTLMVMSIALVLLTGVTVFGVSLLARRRSDLLVPPHLQGLDPALRRVVTATADGGMRAEDPRLAAAVVAHARRQVIAMVLLIASGVLTAGTRIFALATGDTDASAFDVVVLAFWLACAVGLARHLVRTRRALAANRADLG